MSEEQWQPAILIDAHKGAKDGFPDYLFAKAPPISETRSVVLIRERPGPPPAPIICDAKKYYDVRQEGYEIACVCEHEILTD